MSKRWEYAICLLVLGAVCAFIGIYCAGIGLHDGDTCWNLAIGRLITTSRTLPTVDPYSFTWGLSNLSPNEPHRLVIYQWLAEVIFYNVYRIGQLPGLLIVCSVVFALALVALPFELSRRLGAPWWWSLSVVTLGVLACSWHFFVRAEVFALLMLSSSLWFMAELRIMVAPASSSRAASAGGSGTVAMKHAYLCIGGMALTCACWCNLHCTFVAGPLYAFAVVAVYVCAQIIAAMRRAKVQAKAHERGEGSEGENGESDGKEAQVWGGTYGGQIRLFLTAAICCAAATLLNPYGVGLWTALPGELLPPCNKYIAELDPLSSQDLLRIEYLPFTLLSIACLAQLRLLSRKIRLSPELLLSALFMIGVVAASMGCRRTISVAVPILICESAHIWRLYAQCPKEASQLSSGSASAPARSTSLFFVVLLPVVIVLSASIGAYICAVYWTQPTLPKSSVVFQPPFKSLGYIEKFKPQGRVLDFPPFGDVLIWYFKDVPPLFIDTRYNIYDVKIFLDYRCMQHCGPGWEKLLDQYNIGWVYMPPQTEIAQQLEHAKRWKMAYKDATAEIFTRCGSTE